MLFDNSNANICCRYYSKTRGRVKKEKKKKNRGKNTEGRKKRKRQALASGPPEADIGADAVASTPSMHSGRGLHPPMKISFYYNLFFPRYFQMPFGRFAIAREFSSVIFHPMISARFRLVCSHSIVSYCTARTLSGHEISDILQKQAMLFDYWKIQTIRSFETRDIVCSENSPVASFVSS